MKKIALDYQWEQLIFGLGEDDVGRLFKAMIAYSIYGKEIEMSGLERFVWPSARLFINRGETVHEEE